MLLDAGSVAPDTDRKVGSHSPGANMVTPIDENSCYYFWNNCRDTNLDSEEIDNGLRHGIGDTFSQEDGRMVQLCQDIMEGETDLLSMKPLLLPSDEAAVRARRIVARKLREEAEEEAAEAGVLEAAE